MKYNKEVAQSILFQIGECVVKDVKINSLSPKATKVEIVNQKLEEMRIIEECLDKSLGKVVYIDLEGIKDEIENIPKVSYHIADKDVTISVLIDDYHVTRYDFLNGTGKGSTVYTLGEMEGNKLKCYIGETVRENYGSDKFTLLVPQFGTIYSIPMYKENTGFATRGYKTDPDFPFDDENTLRYFSDKTLEALYV